MLWETDYRFDGYPGGQPSNDGRYFVHLGAWYRHDWPIISVYQASDVTTFTGAQLGIDPANLPKTISHELWLQGVSGFAATKRDTTCLVVNTVQGPRYIGLGASPKLLANLSNEQSPAACDLGQTAPQTLSSQPSYTVGR